MGALIKSNNQTPIEIALQVDKEGRTTAKKLYEFLELDKSNYAKWCKVNILNNSFAEENIDFWAFVLEDERHFNPNPTTDYKLTASFAKKLAMECHNDRGEEARRYFLKVEDLLRETVEQRKLPEISPIQQQLAEAKIRNARARQASIWLKIADKTDIPEYKQICASYASGVLNGTDNIIPLPESTKKTYSATEIGERLGISANKVGSLTNKYGLKTAEYGKWFHDKAKGHAKEVETFRYYYDIIPKLESIIRKEAS